MSCHNLLSQRVEASSILVMVHSLIGKLLGQSSVLGGVSNFSRAAQAPAGVFPGALALSTLLGVQKGGTGQDFLQAARKMRGGRFIKLNKIE